VWRLSASGPDRGSSGVGALPGFLAALQFRNYRLLWLGAFLSSVGTWTQDVALAWLIHSRIGDPFYLGLRAFAADAPLMAFMLLGGAVADRIDRRRILLTSQLLQMGFAATLALLYAAGWLGIEAILLLAFLTGLTQSQSAPTYQAVLTSVVPPLHIPNAVALNSLQFNLSRAIGPAFAAVLLARAGIGACLAANAVSYLAVIVALWLIEVPPRYAAPPQSLRRSLQAGIAHVWGSSVLKTLTLLGAAGSFLGFPLITFLPVLAGDVLGTGAAGYSLLLSSFGAGAIGGALATAQRAGVPRRGGRVLLAFAAYGLFTLAAVSSRRQLFTTALLFAAGWSLVTAFSTLNSLVQENAPDVLKGRILSIYGLAFRGGMPFGSLAAGLAVARVGAPTVIGGFSLTLAVLSGVVYLRNARIRGL